MPQNSSKISAYINFAIKSRKIIFGLDEIKKNIRKCKVILYFDDLSIDSLKKLNQIATENSKNIYKLDDKIDALTTKGVKAFAICDDGLAKAIINEFNIG